MEEFKRYSGIVVKNGDKVLLCKRSPHESLPNEWSIPSGKIENNETPKEAAYREFHEETNVKIKDDIKIVDLFNMYKKDGETKKGLMYVFLHEVNKPIKPNLLSAKDGHEHSECGYFGLKDNPISEKNGEFKKIIMNILKKY
jgi:ADP-ribose pyrophosphatase YjhB (NUDIX family)